jgi:hypothetical protein
MNSGLPSLLDAIFGKQDLALVSLDEIYEVIREFPSFNAGHFLLAKKLKLQADPGYETESMRTALYFNNPFWLQSLLDDGNHFQLSESASHVKETRDEDHIIFEEYPEETLDIIQEESNYTFESYTPIEQPVNEKDELDIETEEILDEKLNSDPERSEETIQSALNSDSERSEETIQSALNSDSERSEETIQSALHSDPVHSEETFQHVEPVSQTVTSFDELMAKYNIQPLDMVDETAEPPEAVLSEPEEVQTEPEAIQDYKLPAAELNPDKIPANNIDQFETPEEVVNEYGILPAAGPTPDKIDVNNSNQFETLGEVINEYGILPADEPTPDKIPANNNDQFETLEEVVNEYGIFEEKVVKKTEHDHDMDAFDEPLDQIPLVSDKLPQDANPVGQSTNTVPADEDAGQIAVDEDSRNMADNVTTENSGIIENDVITEDRESEDAPHQTDEHDYDAFDRPLEEPEQNEVPVNEYENPNELTDYDPDNTGKPVEYTDDSESGANGQMQELSERFDEHQKSFTAFNAKNADSIVFTPYHMVDYFASQGIKLILEDNPPDQFGKQLKSFTDWLKVMRKLPVKPSSEKDDEKENEKIRHFAAHSVEERDILTESMAEVLAKQGMYENAIALFQKLSLIYPPKSAYFASRIEQLKASLP